MLIDSQKVQEAKEKLGDKNAFIIAKQLAITQFDEKNLKSCCPFHAEDTPSFIYNKKSYSFHCFGCQKNVDVIDAFMYEGMTYIEAVKQLFELVGIPYSFGEHKIRTRYQYKYPSEVKCEDKSQVYEYLKLRCISSKTADYLDIRQDEYGNLVFNYYDLNDTLTMVKYRPSHKVKKGENKNWCQQGADTSPILFNINRINTSAPLIICSGELDAASCIEAGCTNAVSIPLGDGNTQWVNECWDWLEQFEEIIICPDNDESGNKFRNDIVPRLGSWRCKIAILPEYYELEDGTRIKIKDINECLYRFGKEKVVEIIVNAKDTPVPSVDDLSNIQDKDLDLIDGIYTGIEGIDKELMRIFFGTLTVVSGSPGSGKTSFLYQIMGQALDQGLDCWLFSRELPSWLTRNWFNYILAGRRHIKEYHDRNDAVYYKVTPEAKEAIGKHYSGKWFVYKDECSNKLDDLISSMTDTVRKYGVKLFILDNLTTIDIGASGNTNELQKQTDTINKLIKFAVTYNVAVILVAHPRKLEKGAEVGMYDISGTANIANLAHRTISLRRVTQKEKQGVLNSKGTGWSTKPCKFDVIINIVKDRLRGRAGFNYGLYYDIPSRRFFSNRKEFEYNYQWDENVYEDHLDFPVEDEEAEIYGRIKEE